MVLRFCHIFFKSKNKSGHTEMSRLSRVHNIIYDESIKKHCIPQALHYCCLQFIYIYNNIQDNNQKQQNFLKITNSGAATQQRVVRFI